MFHVLTWACCSWGKTCFMGTIISTPRGVPSASYYDSEHCFCFSHRVNSAVNSLGMPIAFVTVGKKPSRCISIILNRSHHKMCSTFFILIKKNRNRHRQNFCDFEHYALICMSYVTILHGCKLLLLYVYMCWTVGIGCGLSARIICLFLEL